MAQTPTPGNHSAQRYSPWNRYKVPATVLWGSTANTCIVTDEKVSTNSFVEVNVTGTTPQAGRWSITANNGNFVITSSDAESATLPLSYIIL